MKNRNQRVLLLPVALVLASTVSLLAQSTAPAVSKAPINAFCPVQTDEPVDPNITTVYRGQTVAFCCETCRRKFEANPERYAGRLAALAKDGDETHAKTGTQVQPSETGAPEESPSQDLAHGKDAHEHAAAHDEAQVHEEHEHGETDEHEASETHGEHEHHHPVSAAGFAALIAWLGNFHPPVVNFPIAMIVGAAMAEGLWMATKRQFFANAGRFCLWIGGLGAVAAGVLGWFFGGFHLTDASWIMTTHRWLGTVTASCAFVTLVVGERAYRSSVASKRGVYRVLLLISALAVLITGFFGGAMVYGINHYAW